MIAASVFSPPPVNRGTLLAVRGNPGGYGHDPLPDAEDEVPVALVRHVRTLASRLTSATDFPGKKSLEGEAPG